MTEHKRCARSLTQESLIAIGFTSGLGSIACSVITASSEPEEVWSEVMAGPRKKRSVSHYRRWGAQRLMFEIIFDRWPPRLIALGPPSDADEPIEWVVFMRSAVFELGKSINVPVRLFDTDDDLAIGLGAAHRGRGAGLKTLIQKQLPDFTSNKRRVILSTATAMAGALQIRNTEGI